VNRHPEHGASERPPRIASALAAMLVAYALLVTPAVGAEPGASAAPEPAVVPAEPVGGPSVHYTEALGHAADDLTFEPGGRVTVPYRPRPSDRWAVGGAAPRALPAGRASGVEMATALQGSRWTPVGAAPAPAAPAEAATAPRAAGDPAAGGLFREVFGFLPYWELWDSSLDLDLSVLSTIAYFSVDVDRAGNLLKQDASGGPTTGWSGWTSARMTNVIDDAHRSGTRVVLTVTSFAWEPAEAQAQAALLGSSTARANLARQAAAAVRDRGADGINLDFEPIASGHGANFTALVRSVRAELDAIAPGYQLTFDTTGFIGNYPIEDATAPGGADAIFVMGYDFKTAGSNPVGSIAPLQGPTYDVSDAIAQYVARAPPSKLILGVPYYGRVWSTASDKPGSANTSGVQHGASGSSIYSNATTTAAEHGRRWDAGEASPYVAYRRENCTATYGCVTAWRQLWYDDAQSLQLKYDLVNDRDLRGAGIWALGYDTGHDDLDETLAASFLHDTTGPVAGIHFVPWRQRDAGFVVGWSGRDVSGIASWDVQVSTAGGPWERWLERTTATSDVFLAESGVGYGFRVRATDGKGNVGTWDVNDTWRPTPVIEVGGFGGVRVDGLAMRAGPTTSATQLGQLAAGRIVSIVGGPVSAGGHTWWEAEGPLREWRPVGPVTRFWVAQGSATAPLLVASRVPSSTIVDAVLRDLEVGEDAAGTAGEPPSRSFSPNGDGRRDTIAMTWTNATALTKLELRILRPDGSVVGTRPLTTLSAGPQRLDWDGTAAGGTLPDGTYMLALAGTAGGVEVAAPSRLPTTAEQIARFGVTLDTIAPTLDRSASTFAVFSPNGDGRFDELGVSVAASEAVTWSGTAAALDGPAPGFVVRSTPLEDGTWLWNGRDDAGAVVPDGRYRMALWASDAAGNLAVRTWSIVVDTVAPALNATLSPAAFSPNGDGVGDSVELTWTTSEAVSAGVQVVTDGVAVAGWPVATSGSFTWDGRDANGAQIRDGAHLLRVGAFDVAGNLALADRPVVVDRTLARVAWAPALFFPHDGDTLAPSATVSFELAGPARTTVRILGQDHRYIRTAWGSRDLSAGVHRWTWDGRAGTGHLVARGWYRVVVTAQSAVGTSTQTKLVLVDAFTATPSSLTPATGESLSLDLRTAEPLTGVPTVTFRQSGRPPVTKPAAAYASGRYRVEFTVAAGAGPASLAIVARDGRGGSNSQWVAVTVR